MKTHPATEIFPMLQGEDFDALVSSIQKFGQQVPCVRDGDTLLDGRNRLAACEKLGIQADFVEYRDVVKQRGIQPNGEDEYPLPSEYILAINLNRRQLTSDQMTMVGAKWLPIFQAEAKARMKAGKGKDGSGGRGRKKTLAPNGAQVSSRSNRSDAKASAKVGVSERKIRQAADLIRSSPELAAKVESGKLKLNEAVAAVPKQSTRPKPPPALYNRIAKAWAKFWKNFAADERMQVKKWISEQS
jgi:hypothetical protein